IQTNVVSWNEFRGHVGGNAGQSPEARTKGTEGNEVIIMSDVQKLQQKHVTDLEEFVKNGGSVIIFPGPDCDEAWYNKELYHDGKGLMPCQFKGAEHVTEGQAPARIISQRYTHPATSYFNDAPGLHLQAAAFQHWMRFDKIEGDSRVLLSLDRGDPLIVEKSLGKGRVILVASTANTRWNNLPLQPVFVPLMQRLVTYLASQSAAPQAQMCGTTLHVNIAKDHNQDVFTLTDPLNQAHELKPLTDKDGAASVEFADTQQPGIYELRSNFAPKTDPPRRFAFYLNAAESDFSTTPSAKTREIATRLGAGYAENFRDYERLDRTRRHGSEIWQPLLLGLLLLLFGEVFLQQRISKA
ncbi:MAG: hypothetical protein WCN98_19130, partial [Verrucomicrobiaceae bacterium]